MTAVGPADTAPAPEHVGKRIMVLLESGRAGVAAVELARRMAERGEATVTVIGIAPQAPIMRGCGPSARDYNAAVVDSVTKDLARAEEMLWGIGPRASCRLLIEGVDPPLEEFAGAERFDVALLPAHRRLLQSHKHPAAAALARAGAEVRIVDPRTR
jgi:hypothetical protein